MYVCTDICTLRVDVKIFESAKKHLRIKKYTGNGGGLGLSTYAQYLISRPQSRSAEFETNKGLWGQ